MKSSLRARRTEPIFPRTSAMLRVVSYESVVIRQERRRARCADLLFLISAAAALASQIGPTPMAHGAVAAGAAGLTSRPGGSGRAKRGAMMGGQLLDAMTVKALMTLCARLCKIQRLQGTRYVDGARGYGVPRTSALYDYGRTTSLSTNVGLITASVRMLRRRPSLSFASTQLTF